MELRVLQYFLAVAREQSISGAARALHLSQPTLSTQLKALEAELGSQLLIRGAPGSRKITLTEDGMILRKRAEEILDLVKKTEAEISLSDGSIIGDVYIGAGETDLIRSFARAAKALQKECPGIRYHISSGNAPFVTEQLDKGLIDFGLLYTSVDRAKYNTLSLPEKDVWGVLMRKDSPLAKKEAITPADLKDKPLIVSSQKEDGFGISEGFKTDVARLNIVAAYNLIFNASLLTDEGLGYTICLDKLINTTGESSLCFRPLSPKLEANATIVWKKYQLLSKPAERFLEMLREFI